MTADEYAEPDQDDATDLRAWRDLEDADYDRIEQAFLIRQANDAAKARVLAANAPTELCGIDGCTFMPHTFNHHHSWQAIA